MAAILPAGKRGGGDYDDYKSIHSEEEASLIPKKDGDGNDVEAPSPKHKKKKKKKKKKVSIWQMLRNWNFLFFFVNCLAPFGIAVWWYMLRPETSIPYMVSGLVGITVSVSGYRTFNQLMAIIHNVNKFEQNNTKFRNEHGKIRGEVDNIKKANKDLKQTEQRLRGALVKNRENLDNFREIQEVMKKLDIKDFQTVANKANSIGNKWRDQLIAQERDMLNIVFGRYEMAHQDQQGMSKKEFEEFSKELPDAYKERFARLGTFEKLANENGRLEFSDFELVLDVFAQMVVDDVDIEFEVAKDEQLPESELVGAHESTQSFMSHASDASEHDEDDEEEKKGGGFLSKLASWRTHRRENSGHNVSRQLKIKSTTPVHDNVPASFDMFGMFKGKGKKKEDDKSQEKEKEKAKMGNTLSPHGNGNGNGNKEQQEVAVRKPPKPVKSMSTLQALDEDALDEEEIDDETINAYMAKQMTMKPAADEEP